MTESALDEIDQRAELIVRQCGGIFPAYEAFYIHSIMYSADRCLESFERYDWLRDEGGSGPDQVSAIHEALGHAGSLSRYFWSSGAGPRDSATLRKLRKARAAKLRQAFSMTEQSPLHYRALRDALEHFDERIDRYLLTSDAGQYYPVPRIGDSDGLPDGVHHTFKLVDPEREVFLVLDQRFEFGPVRHEASRVLRTAHDMSNNGDRLPSGSEA